jgi:hypothetical protein
MKNAGQDLGLNLFPSDGLCDRESSPAISAPLSTARDFCGLDRYLLAHGRSHEFGAYGLLYRLAKDLFDLSIVVA